MTADPDRNRHWLVSQPATASITAYAEHWARTGGQTVILRQNIFRMLFPSGSVASALAKAVATTGMAGIDAVDTESEQARHVSMAPGGDGVFQVINDQLGWSEQVAIQREVATAMPEYTAQAFVRSSLRGALGITDVDVVQKLPGIREYHLRYNKHLLGDFVPDAHGIQVLRDEHLARAHNLSRWQITPLGHGRNLVEAADLAPWYADLTPNPGVLAKARADFGEMILTEEVIKANPPPWVAS